MNKKTAYSLIYAVPGIFASFLIFYLVDFLSFFLERFIGLANYNLYGFPFFIFLMRLLIPLCVFVFMVFSGFRYGEKIQKSGKNVKKTDIFLSIATSALLLYLIYFFISVLIPQVYVSSLIFD